MVKMTSNYKATIKKVVASYNRKLSYYKKKGIEGLPEKASVKKITGLGSIKTINRELRLLSSLNKKSISPIVVKNNLYTSFEKKYFQEKVKASKLALRNRIKEIGKIELKTAGRGAGFTYNDRFDLLYGNINEGLNKGRIRSDKLISNMRKYERISTTSFKDYVEMSKDEKKAFMNLLDRAENPYVNQKLKEQFLNSLNDLGYAYGIDNQKLSVIEENLNSLTNEEFEKVFSHDLAVQKIFDYYYLMKLQLGRNSLDNQSDVQDLFDTLYDNIGEIVKR